MRKMLAKHWNVIRYVLMAIVSILATYITFELFPNLYGMRYMPAVFLIIYAIAFEPVLEWIEKRVGYTETIVIKRPPMKTPNDDAADTSDTSDTSTR